jgi:hypothetical protein
VDVDDAIPPKTRAYLDELVGRLRTVPGTDLVGVYLGGSLALGGFDERRSDIDVAAVGHGALSDATKDAIVGSLRHESLACPARGLELVAYTAAAVRTPSAEPAYELNLNTGRAMPFHVSYAPGDDGGEGEHWYAIDRAILRERGRVLLGPPAAEVFAAMPRAVMLRLLAESIRWHEEAGIARGDDAVLNACRALRYAEEGHWWSKQAAGEWAVERLGDGALVSDALAVRHGTGDGLDAVRVRRFLPRSVRLARAGGRRGGAPLTRASSRFYVA